MYNRNHFDQLREQEVLKALYPQVAALIDVPQPAKWHPEGDAYEHTMMVLEETWRYRSIMGGDFTLLNLGALCHDFGKALTKQENWPKHYGHENLGIDPTKQFLFDNHFSKHIQLKVAFLTKYHMHIHKTFELNPKTYKKIWDEALSLCENNATEANKLLTILSYLGECDHYGRGGVDRDMLYYNPEVFRMVSTEPYRNKDAYEACKTDKEKINLFAKKLKLYKDIINDPSDICT